MGARGRAPSKGPRDTDPTLRPHVRPRCGGAWSGRGAGLVHGEAGKGSARNTRTCQFHSREIPRQRGILQAERISPPNTPG